MRQNTYLMPEWFYISASRINLYNQCEKCFYLKYILGVPAPTDDSTPFKYGTAVHNTVDAISQWKNYEVKKEDLNSEEDYKSYLWHKELIEKEFAQEWEVDDMLKSYFVPEIEFVAKMCDMPVYWFLDWLVFDHNFKRELEIRDFVPRAVERQSTGQGLLWYWTDSKWEKKVITSEIWKFGESQILKLVEMKTQANKRSYNAIKTNYQFMLYWMINEAFFDNVLFQLVNFYRKPKPWVQKERIEIDSNQRQMLLDKILEIKQKYETNTFRNESTCGHFSPYKWVCENFSIY